MKARKTLGAGVAALAIGSILLPLVAAAQTPLPAPRPIVPIDDPDAFASDLEEPPVPGEEEELAPPTPREPAPLVAPPVSSPPVSSLSPRTQATPAITRTNAPQLQGGFTVRLARAPHMMGDFFGNSFSPMSGQVFIGHAVHHLDGVTLSGINDIHSIVAVDAADIGVPLSGTVYTYSNSSVGSAPFFFDQIITPPLPGQVDNLTSASTPGRTFSAVDSGDTADVYEPFESLPDLTGAPVYDVYEVIQMVLPAAGPGDLLGRTRLQDNNSAMPQDRVYFDYSYFHNAALTAGGVDVNRFAPGFEKTFLGGMGSVEVRVPLGMTINSNLVSGLPADTSNFEMGNVVIAPKLLLSSDPDLAIACGLGVALPTADDVVVRMQNGAEALRVENDAVHLLPYFAVLYAPCGSNSFGHLFLTYDFDVNGNGVYADLGGSSLSSIGAWSDQHLVTLNLSYGRWVYQAANACDRLQGVALSAELHYTGSVSDADSVSGGTFVVGDPTADISLLNATIGGHVRLGQTTFTAGYSLPVTSDDRVFDGELRAIVNRAF